MKITKDNWFRELLRFYAQLEYIGQVDLHRVGCVVCHVIRRDLLLTFTDYLSGKNIPIDSVLTAYTKEKFFNLDFSSIRGVQRNSGFNQLTKKHQKKVLYQVYKGLRNLTERDIKSATYKNGLIAYFCMIDAWTYNREQLHRQIKGTPADKFLKKMEEHSGDYGIKNEKQMNFLKKWKL